MQVDFNGSLSHMHNSFLGIVVPGQQPFWVSVQSISTISAYLYKFTILFVSVFKAYKSFAKSTADWILLKLLFKFYEPTKGIIKFGDKNLAELSYSTFRSKCGVVLQDGYIFSDTIEGNICLKQEKINNINFLKPSFEIINNVNANSETNPESLKKLLVKQIYTTVKWRESIIKMSDNNVNNFIEIGPGKVLTGMVKRTLKNVNCFSINSITDIKNLKNEFKK